MIRIGMLVLPRIINAFQMHFGPRNDKEGGNSRRR